MVDLTANTAGIQSPNPFWLASGPPTNTGEQIMRAFDAGWGGAVWKTLTDPPTQNVSSRLGVRRVRGATVAGINNIELVSDRTVETNLRELREVKRRYPRHAVIASLMLDTQEQWEDVVARAMDAGADGLELNFGCPHGMCERGMGSAVGQEPKVNERITRWVADRAAVPVLVKLTPNVADIVPHGLAAQRGGATGVSLINTIKSITGVDLDTLSPYPVVNGRSTNGGYCGPAVKPIALHMVAALGRDPRFPLPVSGIGGVSTWRDAVEFMLLGASSVQVCTEVMLRGYSVVEDMTDGLARWMESKGYERLTDFIGASLPRFGDWGELDMNYETVARIDPTRCIGCYACVTACQDGGHQCIDPAPAAAGDAAAGPALQGPARVPVVQEDECVGCNLCEIVCPVPGCITMTAVDNGWPVVSYNDHFTRELPVRPPKGSHS